MTYRGKAKKILETYGVGIWDHVRVHLDGMSLEAIILPGPETDRLLYLKLPNGYNVAYDVSRIKSMERIKHIKPTYTLPKLRKTISEHLPEVSIIHCGGTVASRVEYTTGAVAPAFSPEELSNAVPEIFEIANIRVVELMNIFSENMVPSHWIMMARAVEKEFRDGARGVILTHGTDTMHYSSAALAFMLENPPGPIVFTGAMRSSDRPASDAATNLIASVRTACETDIGESVIVMHSSPNDTFCAVLRGVRTVKLHSCRRDAFRSIGIGPIAVVRERVRYLTTYQRAGSPEDFAVRPFFEEKVALIYSYPGITGELIDSLIDRGYRGLVIAGTGLGHVPDYLTESLSRAISEGVIVTMTTQCLWGGVFMNVYETGRMLQKIGVIPLYTMLPHTAYVKLGWLLGQDLSPKELRAMLLSNLRLEYVEREPIDNFPQMGALDQ